MQAKDLENKKENSMYIATQMNRQRSKSSCALALFIVPWKERKKKYRVVLSNTKVEEEGVEEG